MPLTAGSYDFLIFWGRMQFVTYGLLFARDM